MTAKTTTAEITTELLTDLAAEIAKRLLPPEGSYTPQYPYTVNLSRVLTDLRKASKVGRLLKEQGVAVSYYKTVDERLVGYGRYPFTSRTHRSGNKHFVEISEEWFEKNVHDLAKMPEFKFQEIDTSWYSKKVPGLLNHYRNPYHFHFEKDGFLYYYLHQDEFDIKYERHRRGERELRIFPKKDLPKLYDHVMRIKYEAFVMNYPEWCMENLFGIKGASSELAGYQGPELAEGFEEWTPESIQDRIKLEEKSIKAAQQRLSILKSMAADISPNTKIIDRAVYLLGRYVEKNFPLYMTDFSEDEKIKHSISKLCKYYYDLTNLGFFED